MGMAVKRSLSAGRMLGVFERIARDQPIGVSALARQLGADKSAVQRDLMTLCDAGWIRPEPGNPLGTTRWELTPHILTIARAPSSSDHLRRSARPLLERLRAETGETVYLTMPDGDHFVVIDALESFHLLRMVPPIGIVVPLEGSATARAVLPHLPESEQARLLGGPPGAALREDFARARARGYAVNAGDIVAGAIAVAAPILDRAGVPLGTLVVTGPSERLTEERRPVIGASLREAARRLSDGTAYGTAPPLGG
jgi:DNA-binding IclR family transcriptional regulator